MRIGELARLTECEAETIRFYETEGILTPPARTSNNYRVYGPAHVQQLQFIRKCRLLDMSLNEIRTLLQLRAAPFESCAEVNTMLNSHIDSVAARIAILKSLEREMVALRQQCGAGVARKDCGILKSLGCADGDLCQLLVDK